MDWAEDSVSVCLASMLIGLPLPEHPSRLGMVACAYKLRAGEAKAGDCVSTRSRAVRDPHSKTKVSIV